MDDLAMTAPTLADEIAALTDVIISGERTALKYGPMSALYEHNQNCLRSALARLEAMRWRTIETAPEDGTPVDLWCNGARICNARYVVEPRDGSLRNENCLMDGWKTSRDGHYGRLAPNYITHWQPLPSPPEPPEGE